jgi:hypothetical protein
VMGSRNVAGGNQIASRGNGAPTVNDAADAAAECRGWLKRLGRAVIRRRHGRPARHGPSTRRRLARRSAERRRHRAGHQARRPSGEYGATRRGGPRQTGCRRSCPAPPPEADWTTLRCGVRRRGANRGFEPRRPCRAVKIRPGRRLRTVSHIRLPTRPRTVPLAS